MSLRQITSEGDDELFRVRLTRPRDGRGVAPAIRPAWPTGCRPLADDLLRCADGVEGRIELPSLAERRVKCMVTVQWLDGPRFEVMLREGASTAQITRPPRALVGPGPISAAYLSLGVEHIILGPDHLLFVLGLTLLLRTRRALIGAVTGFTVAHSITLGAAALGYVAPPGAAVELIIAASVLLLAREAVTGDPHALTARRPWLLVLPFGLIHGLGFAGALSALGLPPGGEVWALAAFNIGVELGQIAVVAGALLLLHAAPRARAPLGWAAGVIAGYWTLDRALAWLTTLPTA